MFFGHPLLIITGIGHRQAEIVQMDGRNHARLPGRSDLFPLFDYAWRVTVFSVDGQWYRLVTSGQDSPQRQEWKKSHAALENVVLDQKRAELNAMEVRLKVYEQELSHKESAMQAELAKLKAELEAERISSKSPRVQSLVAPIMPALDSALLHVPTFGEMPVATPTSPGKAQRLTFIGARPSLGTSSTASSTESTSSVASGLASQHRQLNRTGSTPLEISGSSSGSTSRPLSALPHSLAQQGLNPSHVMSPSSSLPNTSPIASMAAASPPGSGRLDRIASPATLVPPRRVNSLPLGSPELQQYAQYGGLSRDSSASSIGVIPSAVVGGLETSHSSSSSHSPMRPPREGEYRGFELPEEKRWTQAQCEEWLKQKLYPSTDPNEKTSSGQRAIHCTSLDGQTEVVEFLVARGGVDVNQKDLIGNTPLICAASKGRMETASWLISHGAQLEAVAPSGRTALHSAAAGGYLDVCQLLVSLGADPTKKEQFGKSPRQLAEAYQHSHVSTFLKQAEIDRAKPR